MKVVRSSASRTGRLYPQKMFLVLIFTRGWVDPRAMVRSEGNMSLKNPVTPRGIDPGTVRLVAKGLNHYATPGPIRTCREFYELVSSRGVWYRNWPHAHFGRRSNLVSCQSTCELTVEHKPVCTKSHVTHEVLFTWCWTWAWHAMSPAGINGPIIFSETINPLRCVTHILTPFVEHLSDYQRKCALFLQDIATAHTENKFCASFTACLWWGNNKQRIVTMVAGSEPVQ